MTTTAFDAEHADLHDLAALYAVDALDADEAERFARHLAGCGLCQQEVAEMRTVSTALALAAATPLPPGLRQRILVDIARQPQIPAPPAAPVRPAVGDPAITGAASSPSPTGFDAAVAGVVGPSPEGWPDPARPAAAGGHTPGSEVASAAFDPAVTGVGAPVSEATRRPGRFDPAVTAGAEVVRLDVARGRRRRGRRGPGSSRLLAVAAAVVALAGAVGALAVVRNGGTGGDRTAAEAAFDAVQAAPDARTLALVGGAPGARVQVAWSASQNRVVLLADDVPDPGDGRTYELWRIDAAGPDPAGVFDPDGSGEAGLVAPLDGADPAAWGVTVEPDGGSPAPTPPIVYQAEA